MDVEGTADNACYIDKFVDFEADSTNTLYVPGNQFAIYGHKIKVDGEDPNIGVFFVPVEDLSQAVKVLRIAENTPSKITGIAPETYFINNRIEIRTQFSGAGDRHLKELRSITGNFILEAA